MIKFFSLHARDRAFERYGLELSAHQMWDILSACKDGRAQMMQRHPDGGDVFIWRINGTMIFPVVTPARDFIITFQPRDYFASGTRKKRYITKTTTATAHGIDGREYHRPSPNKRALHAMAEDV